MRMPGRFLFLIHDFFAVLAEGFLPIVLKITTTCIFVLFVFSVFFVLFFKSVISCVWRLCCRCPGSECCPSVSAGAGTQPRETRARAGSRAGPAQGRRVQEHQEPLLLHLLPQRRAAHPLPLLGEPPWIHCSKKSFENDIFLDQHFVL